MQPLLLLDSLTAVTSRLLILISSAVNHLWPGHFLSYCCPLAGPAFFRHHTRLRLFMLTRNCCHRITLLTLSRDQESWFLSQGRWLSLWRAVRRNTWWEVEIFLDVNRTLPTNTVPGDSRFLDINFHYVVVGYFTSRRLKILSFFKHCFSLGRGTWVPV